MARARRAENSVHEGDLRGAAAAAPRSTTPLKLVEGAIGGDDLQSVVRGAAVALSCTVVISLPAFGLSAQWPSPATVPEALAAVEDFAAALLDDESRPAPAELSHVAPVRLGRQLVGVAVALPTNGTSSEAEAWLQAAAAAAAVAALMQRGSDDQLHHARRSFLQMLETHEHIDADALLAEAQRLGYDFSHGAVAVGAALDPARGYESGVVTAAGLLAAVGDRRLLGLVPIADDGDEHAAQTLLGELREAGLAAIATAPRHSAAELQEALHEAAVLLELLDDESAMLSAHEDTYRLLVGVLIRNADELLTLRERTIAPLEAYDAAHDTDLVVTLDSFLSHHGSTSDTAEAMQLHRHTVGYRLARVHEVSGLSPYESEGRERLSLGLKAKQILLAEERRGARLQQGGGPASPADAGGWRASEPLQQGGGPAGPAAPETGD